MPSIIDIPTIPMDGDGFGQQFNYSVWTPNTFIELSQVPWNSDYRDIVKFDSRSDLDTYLSSTATSPIKIERMTYARVGDPVRVNIPFNLVYRFNYLKVYNPAQPVPGSDVGRAYYYFITDVKYIAPNTTEIHVQLDVWQTFGFDVRFGNCFIERGHIGIANENAFDNNGRDYLTVPEGLDLGDEYNINRAYEYTLKIGDTDSWIMMGIGADIKSDPGTISDPSLKVSSGIELEGLPQGIDIVFFKSTDDFAECMGAFNDAPWVTQTIQFIMAIPPVVGADTHLYQITPWGSSAEAYYLVSNYDSEYSTTVVANWRTDATNALPERYRTLKKFLTFPYTMVQMTAYNGQPLVLKPELMPGNHITVNTIQHVSPPSPRWAFYPKDYNAMNHSLDRIFSEYLDMAIHLTNFPQLSVQNNGYQNFMAANRSQISYQHQSANWDYTRNMQSNSVRHTQASESLAADYSMYQSGVQARNATTALNNEMQGLGVIRGTAGGLMGGGAGGALKGGLGSAMDAAMGIHQNVSQNSISNTQAGQNINAQMGAGEYMRDSNKTYSDFAAKGDYQNEIAGINARVQDAKMIQPTVSGQLGGEAFTWWANGGWGIYTKIKQVAKSQLASIGEYWFRYGYAVNRFSSMPDSLKVMDKFTYWKLKETYIISAECPETYKQTIRGIFEKGVTVWSDPSDIGTIDPATNTPLTGITL